MRLVKFFVWIFEFSGRARFSAVIVLSFPPLRE